MKNLAIIILAIGVVVLGFLLYRERTGVSAIPKEKLPAEEAILGNDLIQIENVKENSKISSPITIKGRARGGWYFEASFPVRLVDSKGNVIAEGPAQAQGEWMTPNFVPFEITLSFTVPPLETSGKIIFNKDNPSGLLENDASFEIPIIF